MKYKILGVIAVIVLLLSAFAANAADAETAQNRIHQHLTARQPDAGCSCDGEELCTHLPLVIINTGGTYIPGEPISGTHTLSQHTQYTTTSEDEKMAGVSVAIMDSDDQNHHPSDTPDLTTASLIRYRGNSSRYHDKKNYLLRFTNASGEYADHEVMGMDAHYEWTLHGPYMDKSLIRNYMWYNIAGEIMDYAPNVRFCELIVDDEYMGLYVMTETITNGEDCRLNISEPVDNTNRSGFLLRLDKGSDDPLKNINNFTYYTYQLIRENSQMINIQYPKSGSLTPELAESIEQEFSDFEKALYSYDYDSPTYGYRSQIDVGAFVDYILLTEFTANYDVGSRSTFLYKDIGGKYKPVVWDYNSACNNYIPEVMDPQAFHMYQIIWYNMLMKDEYFTDRLITRYRDLRTSYLSEEYLNGYMDDVVAYLGSAVDRNFEVWGYSLEIDMILPPERNPHSFEAATEQMRDFIHVRGEWLDQNIETIRQYSHYSKNKQFNH